ncbi:MAG: uracil-5--methyltransferase [Monoraphidium minutum]|nr:MAG: uracil-5--methyltransferase [Monoraphidium minutum]
MKGATIVKPEEYESQLDAKAARVRGLFAPFGAPDVEVHRSEPIHYRQRAEFRVWHEGGSCHYIMFGVPEGGAAPRRYRVDAFPVGSEALNVIMTKVMAEAAASEQLRRKLYQVNIHTALSGDAVVTLIYHRALGDEWAAEGRRLRGALRDAPPPGGWQLHVLGRSRKQKVPLDADYVTEVLEVNGRQLAYKQVEGAFSQPNSGVVAQMLAWAQDVTRGSGDHDLLELYCGNGNFTVALAPCFRRVIATEVAKSSVEAARHNLAANGADNVFIARMAAHEFTETWKAKGTRNRLAGMAAWDELDLRTLLVDPPRAGLDDEARQLLGDFDNIVYISCNPETLARDLGAVAASHRLARLAVFDQFPYSEHVECGAYLVRR